MRRLWWMVAALAAAAGPAGADLRNARTVVRAVRQAGAAVGFDVLARTAAGMRPVAEVRFSSEGRWTAASCTETAGLLRFGGLSAPGTGTPRIGAGSYVTVRLAGDGPYPRVEFRLEFDAFDEAAWRRAWANTPPLYFLRCSLPASAAAKQTFYQHGILYPGAVEDPYPISMGPMRGDWCPRWSYAPAMGAAPIPAVGLWSPDSRLFAAYEFQGARTTDRSDKALASSYCAGLPDHPGQFFCLSVPYAGDWLRLKLPKGPVTAASRFRLLYNADLPSDSDPNRFVIKHILAAYRATLPQAPRMNDMSWLKQGKSPTQVRFLHALGLAPDYRRRIDAILYRPYEMCEKPFFEPGAVQLVAHQTGKTARYMVEVGDAEGLAALREQVEYLLPRARVERFGDDACTVWEHPLAGTFKEGMGGAGATSTRHMFNWGIASAMLWLHRSSPEPRYLPVLDGMVKWSRHYIYDLAGMADLPWAVFSMGAANGGEFLLDYYDTFHDDPTRRALADEAWELAETLLWRNTYWYTGDPIETDARDPSFLLQAVNSSYWLGKVTWGEMGRIPEMAIRLYLETGEPFWKYLVRGCLEQYHIGVRNAAGEYVENLDVFGQAGTSGGWGGNDFRWLAEPLGGAVMQVDVGRAGAIAFCTGTVACDIESYARLYGVGFGFTVIVNPALPGAPRGAFDIMVTSPHEALTGKKAFVNGVELPANRLVADAAGLNVMIRGVKHGDRVSFGAPLPATDVAAPLPPLPTRSAWSPTPSANFAFADLRSLASAPIDNTWSGAWGGLRPGPHVAEGAAFCLIDPAENRGVGAVDLAGPVVWKAPAGGAPGRAMLLLGRAAGPLPTMASVTARFTDGSSRSWTLLAEEGAETLRGNAWYDKAWTVRAFSVGADGKRPAELTLKAAPGSGVCLLAITTSRNAAGSAALDRMARTVELRRGLQAYQRIQSPVRRSPVRAPWGVPGARLRFVARVAPADGARVGAVIRLRQDLAVLAKQVGETPPAGVPSVIAQRIDASGRAVATLPAQFCPDEPGSSRGDMLLRVPGKWSGPIWVAFYLGAPSADARAVRLQVADGVARVTGPRSRFAFRLAGGGIGPRMVELAFDKGRNLLRKAGHDEGFGHLCACQDGVTWYDFGALQSRDAAIRMDAGGPLATTLHIDGLELYGEGAGVAFSGVGTPGARGAEVKGTATWHFRVYHDSPAIDSWVTTRISDPGVGWTRPIEARFGVAAPETGKSLGDPEAAGAFGSQGGLALVALDDWRDRCNVSPRATAEDGAVLSAVLNTPVGIGHYASDRWRMLPSRATDEALAAEAGFASVIQYALEVRDPAAPGGARRPAVRPMEAVDDATPEAGWDQIVPAWAASLTAGRPDLVRGLASKDNPDEGASVREDRGGSVVIAPGTDGVGGKQAYYYFDVDEAHAAELRRGRTVIAVEYLDQGRGSADIQYDSSDLSVRVSANPGAFKPATRQIVCGDTGQWKTLVLGLPDARFADGCNNADLRVSAEASTIYIRRIAVWRPGVR